MTDDTGPGEERHDRETEEFGGPLFPDRSRRGRERGDDSSGAIRFGPNDTGPLPHWTDPPTGEVPRVLPEKDPSEDVDVWSTFTTETPVWRDDPDSDPTGPGMDADSGARGAPSADPSGSGGVPRPRAGEYGVSDPSGGVQRPIDPSGPVPSASPTSSYGVDPSSSGVDPTGETARDTFEGDPSGSVPAQRPGPNRIQIGTDPSGVQRRQPPTGRGLGRRAPARPAPRQQSSSRAMSSATGRDLPTAIVVGVVIAALFVGAVLWRPVAVVALVTAILVLAGYEYLAKISEKGYRPVVAAGLAAIAAAPLVVYWFEGLEYVTLVIAFAFLAGATSFIGARSVEAGPLPNMAVTTMGIIWIGLLGSYAVAILNYSNFAGGNDIGTDTLALLVLGVVANDVGALFVGSATGNTVLRPWISPNKSLEGLIGGTVLTIVSLIVVGIADLSTTWNDIGELLILGVVISVMAPLGDLTESMFKRNLDVKDFGAVVRGHGGILDRFDSFLFVLPAVYYLMVVLEPWASR